jgi:hypothetical protein
MRLLDEYQMALSIASDFQVELKKIDANTVCNPNIYTQQY